MVDDRRAGLLGNADRAIGAACGVGGVVAGLCMNALVAVVLAEMIGRNLFGISMSFVLDLGGWLMVILTFVALGWVMREKGHVRLTLLVEQLPPRPRIWAFVTADLIALGFCAFFFVSAWRSFSQAYRTGVSAAGALDLPVYPVWILVLVGIALLALQLAVEIAAAFRALRLGGPAGEGS